MKKIFGSTVIALLLLIILASTDAVSESFASEIERLPLEPEPVAKRMLFQHQFLNQQVRFRL
jgi:hypothetical protein